MLARPSPAARRGEGRPSVPGSGGPGQCREPSAYPSARRACAQLTHKGNYALALHSRRTVPDMSWCGPGRESAVG